MRLWRKASGALKDQNSLWLVSLTKRTTLQIPEIEAAVIKATNHDEFSIDSKHVEMIYKWIGMSSLQLKPVLWAISMRMEKTRNWVVALKGLMLMHGIFACKIPEIQQIGRLPFDLSNFKDGHSRPVKTWAYNSFIRAYYAFLDHKSTLLYMNMYDRKSARKDDQESYSLMQQLLMVQKLQGLLDFLLQIRPLSYAAVVPLILEAMDCVLLEIFDVYSRICSGIARVLLRIYSIGKVQAAMALRVVRKATIQGEELALYFEICRGMGLMNAAECPPIEQIPHEDICELEQVVSGVSKKSDDDQSILHQGKAMVVREAKTIGERKDAKNDLRTIITHDWETFDDELKVTKGEPCPVSMGRIQQNPFADSLKPLPVDVHGKNDDLPDLISFL